MRNIAIAHHLTFRHSLRSFSRLYDRSHRCRLYVTDINSIPSTPPKKRLFRSLVLPTAFFGGIFYGVGIYGSFHNDQLHDFFVEKVPLGETLVNLCAESNLEQLGDASKKAIEFTGALIKSAKETVGLETRPEPPQLDRENNESPINQMRLKTDAAVKRGQEMLPDPTAPNARPKKPEPVATVPTSVVNSTPPLSEDQKSPECILGDVTLPTYPGVLPIGHEPPPGFLGSSPRPRDPCIGPAPSPPALPLLAPSVKQLSSSEPILGQLASTIDRLAGFLRDHPEVVVRAKDESGQDAPRVLLSAQTELKQLAERLETIKAQERVQLERQLDTQAKKYSKMLLDAEKELHERLDQQEENWQDTFELERSRLARGFEAKLARELEAQEELIDERLRQEVISKGLEMQRKWMREIKSQVELEREGRLGKLNELESSIKELERVTIDNEEYLDENLRVNKLWNSLRAMSAAAFDQPMKRPLTNEAGALRSICASGSKFDSDLVKPCAADVLSVAVDCVPSAIIESGVENLPNLTVWFKDSVAPRIQSASLFPEHGGLISYLASHLLSHLLFTNSHIPGSKDPVSVITRVNAYLDAKDLDMATRELNRLDGWPKVLARDWLQAARRHLELQQMIQVIETEARVQSLLL